MEIVTRIAIYEATAIWEESSIKRPLQVDEGASKMRLGYMEMNDGIVLLSRFVVLLFLRQMEGSSSKKPYHTMSQALWHLENNRTASKERYDPLGFGA